MSDAQYKREVDAVLAEAFSQGMSVNTLIRIDDVRRLMVWCMRRGAAIEKENYAACSRGTDELNFGDTGGQTKA